MKRINIDYGGTHYTIGGQDIEAVQKRITDAIMHGRPFWLTVNEGEGTLQEARLLITAGTSIALMPIREPSAESDDMESDDPHHTDDVIISDVYDVSGSPGSTP